MTVDQRAGKRVDLRKVALMAGLKAVLLESVRVDLRDYLLGVNLVDLRVCMTVGSLVDQMATQMAEVRVAVMVE